MFKTLRGFLNWIAQWLTREALQIESCAQAKRAQRSTKRKKNGNLYTMM